MLLLGFLACAESNPLIASTFKTQNAIVSLAGGFAQFKNQLIGVSVTMAWAVVATLVILKLVELLVGLRVTEEDEFVGLDLTQHGEKAYND